MYKTCYWDEVEKVQKERDCTPGEVAEIESRKNTPPQVPQSVSPRQIRQALSKLDLRKSVENAVASGDQDLKDWWEFSTEFVRGHPMVLGMATSLGISEGQLDGLWIEAFKL